MSNISRLQTVFESIADRAVPAGIAAEFLNAVVDDRGLEPDPENPGTNEERAGLALQWMRRVLKEIRADVAVKDLRAQAAAFYQSTLTDSEL